MEQVQLALRDQICRLGVPPDITADVLGAYDAQNRLRVRRHIGGRPPARAAAVRHVPAASQPIALRDVPQAVAPFCHDVLLFRAFIGPAYQDAARDWLGPQMWHIACALGGWRRLHTVPLARLADEAMAARQQAPSFLQPPSYKLLAMNMQELWDMTRPWARKYACLGRLHPGEMAKKALTAGAWLWVMDRTDADVRRRGAGPDRDLPGRAMRLAERVDAAVGLARERR